MTWAKLLANKEEPQELFVPFLTLPAPSSKSAVFLKSSNNLIKIGKILEAKGLRGEVKVLFFSGDAGLVDDIDQMYFGGQAHKIESVSATSKTDRVNIKFNQIDNRDDA